MKAEDLKQEDDDSDYTEDGGRKPNRGKKPSKRALSSEAQSGSELRSPAENANNQIIGRDLTNQKVSKGLLNVGTRPDRAQVRHDRKPHRNT